MTNLKERNLNIYGRAWNLVQIQAEIEGLWLPTKNSKIALLQQELRRLHAVIEGDDETYYDRSDFL